MAPMTAKHANAMSILVARSPSDVRLSNEAKGLDALLAATAHTPAEIEVERRLRAEMDHIDRIAASVNHV